MMNGEGLLTTHKTAYFGTFKNGKKNGKGEL